MQSEPPDHMPPDDRISERPWIHLGTEHDVEAWINNFDWGLRRHAGQANVPGAGICFRLAEGGEMVLHTTAEGAVLLELAPDAEWVAPVVTAATGVAAPNGRTWMLPGDVLTQLVLGLSGLIASSRPVTGHAFKTRNKQRIEW